MPGAIADDSRARAGTGTRDREAYFAAAMQLLAERGCDAVTIAGLCERLQVTHGSFYHHFENMAAFVAAFAEHWQALVLGLYAGWEAEPDPVRRYELIGSGLELMDSEHLAIGAWSRTEPVIAAAVETCRQAWTPLGIRVVTEIVGDPQLAEVLQMMIECICVGIALRPGRPGQERFRRVQQEIWRRCAGRQLDLAQVGDRQELKFRGKDSHHPHRASGQQDPGPFAWAQNEFAPDTGTPTPRRRSRGREAYFHAAWQILGERGPDGLTVDALCRRLSVTKGSFQWHFERMPLFVQALADHWEQDHDGQLAAQGAEPDPLLRLQQLHRQLLAPPDLAAAEWRAWAHTEPVVGRAVHRIDGRRQNLLAATITEAGQDPEAPLLAEAMLGLAIAFQESQLSDIGPELTARIVLEWARRMLLLDARIEVHDGRPTILLA